MLRSAHAFRSSISKCESKSILTSRKTIQRMMKMTMFYVVVLLMVLGLSRAQSCGGNCNCGVKGLKVGIGCTVQEAKEDLGNQCASSAICPRLLGCDCKACPTRGKVRCRTRFISSKKISVVACVGRCAFIKALVSCRLWEMVWYGDVS